MNQGSDPASEAQAFLAGLMRRRPAVSWTVAAACVAVFGLQLLWGGGEPMAAATRMGAEVPTRVLAGEWWRLFAVMLLHANFVHLLMNMLALLSFGPFLERLVGSARYGLIYVFSGLGGSLLSLSRGGETVGVGASGGIWGLMIAGAVVVTWPRGLLPPALAAQLRRRAWMPVLINGLYSLSPGVDLLAHFGGGLAGGLLVYALARPPAPLELPRKSTVVRIAAAVVGVLLAASMGLSLVRGRPWALSQPWTLERKPIGGSALSLEVPADLSAYPEPARKLYRWGDINLDGVSVIVLVSEVISEAEAENPSEFLEGLRKGADQPAKTLRYSIPPKVIRLPSGREVVFAELVPLDPNDVRFLWMWWLLTGRQPLMVLENVLNSTSSDRRAQLKALVDTVRVGPGSP